jgi:hypothetical protein
VALFFFRSGFFATINHSLLMHRVRIVLKHDRQNKGNLWKEEKKREKKMLLTSRQAIDLAGVLLKSTSAEKRANIASLANQMHRLHVYSKKRCKGRFSRLQSMDYSSCTVWFLIPCVTLSLFFVARLFALLVIVLTIGCVCFQGFFFPRLDVYLIFFFPSFFFPRHVQSSSRPRRHCCCICLMLQLFKR